MLTNKIRSISYTSIPFFSSNMNSLKQIKRNLSTKPFVFSFEDFLEAIRTSSSQRIWVVAKTSSLMHSGCPSISRPGDSWRSSPCSKSRPGHFFLTVKKNRLQSKTLKIWYGFKMLSLRNGWKLY